MVAVWRFAPDPDKLTPMYEGFAHDRIDTGETVIDVRWGGTGPPLLLLHGFPQTKAMWARCAAELASDFTVYAADLRGYGDSGKPSGGPGAYSKRVMARDMIAVMRRFGHERFDIAGHDRGGRVAYRLALDHPQAVRRVAVLDIIPTSDCYDHEPGMVFAMDYWHWYFLAQPQPVPERIIAADPDYVLFRGRDRGKFAPEADAEYSRVGRDAQTVHAMCEDYRAGATVDLELDRADRAAGAKIAAPLLVLWGAHGALPRWGDVLDVWRGWADDLRGQAMDCGHYLPEERPAETAAALRAFFL
jgi:haloacetate dehalogenase